MRLSESAGNVTVMIRNRRVQVARSLALKPNKRKIRPEHTYKVIDVAEHLSTMDLSVTCTLLCGVLSTVCPEEMRDSHAVLPPCSELRLSTDLQDEHSSMAPPNQPTHP